MHKLLIVESPTKAKTISRFLPKGEYKVRACMGHVRDLPSGSAEVPAKYRKEKWARLGVRIDHDFEPIYVVSSDKRKVVRELAHALKDASELLIATDEDREGEAIGWHLLEVLKPKVPVRRMVFHEITKSAIARALENTRQIDKRLVEAQETRRILDRLVGYEVSPVLWRKIRSKLSAGRVQSVAVRLLVLRERKRLAFVAATYWSLQGTLSKVGDPTVFEATLTHLGVQRIAIGSNFDENTGKLKKSLKERGSVLVLGEEEAQALRERAAAGRWQVEKVESKESRRRPSPPFITSTLQQEASRKFGWAAKMTMRVAQRLYEKGLITYMRTDSVSLSKEAVEASRKAARSRYGEAYVSKKPRVWRSKVRNAQEAHEAIRPAGTRMQAARELSITDTQENRLYDLIWKRTVASQMADARIRQIAATIAVTGNGLEATFRATGQTVLFPGFMRAYVEGAEDPAAALAKNERLLPSLESEDPLTCHGVEAKGHRTKAPARYTEATLIQRLEKEGIGRPSTYASVMDRVQRVGYAQKTGRALGATFTAFASNNLLEAGFDRLVDTGFTASLEENLDNIAAGTHERLRFLHAFYGGQNGLAKRVAKAQEQVDPRAVSSLTAPPWGRYVIRVGRHGPYVESDQNGVSKRASLPEEWLPADVTETQLSELLKTQHSPALGRHPETGQEIHLKRGRYGMYCEMAPASGEDKPKRVTVPRSFTNRPEDLTLEHALKLLSMPLEIGRHPESGLPIRVGIGRYGPYVHMDKTYASLKKEDDLFSIGLGRAVELLATKKQQATRVLGNHPATGKEIMIGSGRYGPYVKLGRIYASIGKDRSPESITLEEAVALIDAKKAKKTARRRTTRRKR